MDNTIMSWFNKDLMRVKDRDLWVPINPAGIVPNDLGAIICTYSARFVGSSATNKIHKSPDTKIMQTANFAWYLYTLGKEGTFMVYCPDCLLTRWQGA